MSMLVTGVLVIGTVVAVSTIVAIEEKKEEKAKNNMLEHNEEQVKKFITSTKYDVEKETKDTYKIQTNASGAYMMLLEKSGNTIMNIQIEEKNLYAYQKINGNVHISSKNIKKETEKELTSFLESQEWKNKIDLKELKRKEHVFLVPYMDTSNRKLREDLEYLEEKTNEVLKEEMSIRDRHRIEAKNNALVEIIKKFNKLKEEEKPMFELEITEIVEQQLIEMREVKKNKEKENLNKLNEEIDFFKKL